MFINSHERSEYDFLTLRKLHLIQELNWSVSQRSNPLDVIGEKCEDSVITQPVCSAPLEKLSFSVIWLIKILLCPSEKYSCDDICTFQDNNGNVC